MMITVLLQNTWIGRLVDGIAACNETVVTRTVCMILVKKVKWNILQKTCITALSASKHVALEV
jgi:hypothetical protein